MNSNSVVLKFDKALTRVSGRPFGEYVYNEQIKDKLNLNTGFSIEFPEVIDYVTISFVQGLFHTIINQIGLVNTLDRVTIVTQSKELTDKIYNDIKAEV